MVKVTNGKNWKGEPCNFYIDGYLKTNIDDAVDRVKNKNWDYVGIVCGLPGAGKSNFAQTVAKYCCSWFDLSYVAFTDEEFIKISNEAPDYSSIVLDESFASLNTRISNSPNFIRIVNHLQLIRQKHLFIFLCLPNFFDLSKGISIYRSSHLFWIFADEDGDRGRFAAFDRNTKRELYIKGHKFMDYSVTQSNFYGRFLKQKVIDESKYELKKREHLMKQETEGRSKGSNKVKSERDILIRKDYRDKLRKQVELADITGLSVRTIKGICSEEKY